MRLSSCRVLSQFVSIGFTWGVLLRDVLESLAWWEYDRYMTNMMERKGRVPEFEEVNPTPADFQDRTCILTDSVLVTRQKRGVPLTCHSKTFAMWYSDAYIYIHMQYCRNCFYLQSPTQLPYAWGLEHTVSCTICFALTQVNVFENLGRDLHLFVAFRLLLRLHSPCPAHQGSDSVQAMRGSRCLRSAGKSVKNFGRRAVFVEESKNRFGMGTDRWNEFLQTTMFLLILDFFSIPCWQSNMVMLHFEARSHRCVFWRDLKKSYAILKISGYHYRYPYRDVLMRSFDWNHGGARKDTAAIAPRSFANVSWVLCKTTEMR